MDENNNQNEQYDPGHFMEDTKKRYQSLTKKQKIALGAGALAALGGIIYIRRMRHDVDRLTDAVAYMLTSSGSVLPRR